ncbi:MAG: uridine kinase [Bacteroidetes bacterium]|nr:uridine kinase [Bacteroidota bacterium]
MFSYLIGISGGSASGKTSFIQALSQLFDNEELCILSQDNYYKEKFEQECDENGKINFDLPNCIDMKSFLNDIRQLKAGKSIRRKEYQFQLEGNDTREIITNPSPVIIVEGLFLLHFEEIFNELDLKIFIDAQDSIKLQRRLERDIKERGVPREQVIYQWENHVLPSFHKYLAPFRDEADIIINNNEHFLTSLQVISDHIKIILNK